jgi:uncharacterized membrane protein YfcA
MKNRTLIMQALTSALIFIAIGWQVTGYLTEHRFSKKPKQLLCAVFLSWLVYTLFRTPQDDDDWAGHY